MHQGNVLREFLRVRGITQSAAASALGVHVNTLRNWMSAEHLDARAAELLTLQWPELAKLIPRPYTSCQVGSPPDVPVMASEPAQTYGRHNYDVPSPQVPISDMTSRYLRLLEKYNELLERYMELATAGSGLKHQVGSQHM